MNEEVRLVGNGEHEEDIWQYSLTTKLFNEYVGQEEAKGNLNVYIQAAKQRGEAIGSRIALWSSRSWEDNISRDYCE